MKGFFIHNDQEKYYTTGFFSNRPEPVFFSIPYTGGNNASEIHKDMSDFGDSIVNSNYLTVVDDKSGKYTFINLQNVDYYEMLP